MGEKGDVDMIHDILLCNQALKDGKARPQSRSRRRPPPQEDPMIQQPTWGKCSAELRSAWIQEATDTKDEVANQFRGSTPKAPLPILKRSSYNVEIEDSDGYDSEATQNTEGTWQLTTNSVMYDTTDGDNNGEGVLVETELNVNAAASGTK